MRVHTDYDLYKRIRTRVERLWRRDLPINAVELSELEYEELKMDGLIVANAAERAGVTYEEYELWIPEIQTWVPVKRKEGKR